VTTATEPSTPAGHDQRDAANGSLKRRGLLAGMSALLLGFLGKTSVEAAPRATNTIPDKVLIQPPAATQDDLVIGTGSSSSGGNTFFIIARTSAANGDVRLQAFRAGGGATQIIADAQSFSTAGTLLCNGASPQGAAPMVLRQLAGNGGLIVTDNALPNDKQFSFGFNPAGFTFARLEAFQQGVGFIPVAINPLGGNVGIGTTNPTARLHVAGSLQVDGNLQVSGTKARAVDTPSGVKKLYALETPDNWFEDLDTGRLVAGRARVSIDAGFAEVSNTSTEYHVFLTPLGECRGLSVRGKDRSGFDVVELQGGASDIEFEYRIVAKMRGYEGTRLEEGLPKSREFTTPPSIPR
jgi:hypothetical protein